MSLVTEAFAALRSDEVGTPDRWLPVYRRALVEAFEQSLLGEAAELAAFAATALEAQGRYEDAVAELEFAIPRASSSTDATATLLGTLAMTHALASNRDAFDVLAAARALRPQLEHEYSRHQVDGLSANVQLVFMVPGAIESAQTVAQAAREAGFPWIGQGLDNWAIPAIAAVGIVRRARPWAQVFAAETEALRSNYRHVDAVAIQFCLETVQGPVTLDEERLSRVPRNRMARWRAHTAALRSAVLRGDHDTARRHVAALGALAPHVSPGQARSLPALQAAAGGIEGDRDTDLVPPEVVTLANLPGVLAAIEVVVARGSQQQALEWWQWCEASFPPDVLSSLEWPASVERLSGLLATRVGYESRGVRLLERGMRRLREDDSPLEHGICQAQLAELLALGPKVESRRWPALRRDARLALHDLGVDLQHVTTVATDAITWGRVAAARPRLTAREVKVLALLAEGLTYREIGERLDIGWRTVQSHARSIYGKLEVRGRVEAANRARQLGILSSLAQDDL